MLRFELRSLLAPQPTLLITMLHDFFPKRNAERDFRDYLAQRLQTGEPRSHVQPASSVWHIGVAIYKLENIYKLLLHIKIQIFCLLRRHWAHSYKGAFDGNWVMSLFPRGMSSLLHRSSHTSCGLRHLPASLVHHLPGPRRTRTLWLLLQTPSMHTQVLVCRYSPNKGHLPAVTSSPTCPAPLPRDTPTHSLRFGCHTLLKPPSIVPLIAPQALRSAVYLSPLQIMGFLSMQRVSLISTSPVPSVMSGPESTWL